MRLLLSLLDVNNVINGGFKGRSLSSDADLHVKWIGELHTAVVISGIKSTLPFVAIFSGVWINGSFHAPQVAVIIFVDNSILKCGWLTSFHLHNAL